MFDAPFSPDDAHALANTEATAPDDGLPTLSVDLMEAARRSDDAPSEWTDADRAFSLRRYRMWLGLKLRNPTTRLAPTKDIDVFWHLHMLSPVAYYRDCLRLFGKLLDHDGGFGKGPGELELLGRVHQHTAELFEATYGEPYAGAAVGEAADGLRNCWHDCQDRCWHACSDVQ